MEDKKQEAEQEEKKAAEGKPEERGTTEEKGVAEQAEKKKPGVASKIVGSKEAKHEAVIRGMNLPISTKHAIAICKFIVNKSIQEAVSDLEQVTKLKKAIPFRGEIPHRPGKGMAGGRYPVNASNVFIKLLRNLSANVVANGLNLDTVRISAKADLASRTRFSRRYSKFKRSNVLIIAREAKKKIRKKDKK